MGSLNVLIRSIFGAVQPVNDLKLLNITTCCKSVFFKIPAHSPPHCQDNGAVPPIRE